MSWLKKLMPARIRTATARLVRDFPGAAGDKD